MMLGTLVFSGCYGSTVQDTNVSAKTAAQLERGDSAAEIDAEFAERFDKARKAAHKMVVHEDGRLIVHHKYGETIVPEKVERVVVIRLEDLMVALDEPMLGANYKPDHYLYDELKNRNVVNISINDETKTINYEQVQSLHPDLILLRDSFDRSIYDKLSRIAPTAAFNLRQSEASLLGLAMTLGHEQRGEERLRAYYALAKECRIGIRQSIGQSTVAMMRIMNKEIRIYPYSQNDINRFMYELLNLRPPEMVLAADHSTTNNALSLEQLPDLSADILLVSTGYGTSSSQNGSIANERYARLAKDEVWQMIPAVKNGQVIEVDSALWNSHGIIAKERAMMFLYQNVKEFQINGKYNCND